MTITEKNIDTSELELIAGLRSYDQKVFSKIYDLYSAALYGIILRIVDSSAVADDVLQETFIKVWKNAGKYDESKGRLFTWMVNIARNSAIDNTRSKEVKHTSKIQNTSDDVSIMQESHSYIVNTDTLDMSQHVNKLPPEQQKLIELIYFNGYTQQEVSDEFGIPLGTVKTRVRNAILELKKIFKVN